MSDPAPAVVAAMGAAAQSLRDTAKWLVGGVVATAAGVFAGSSLTALGSLDPDADRFRLSLAIGGLVVGFVGLGSILVPAIRVLTRETKTIREIASAGTGSSSEIVALRTAIVDRYKSQMPPVAAGVDPLSDYVRSVDAAYRRQPKLPGDDQLIGQAASDFAVFNADAGFHLVRNRFRTLLRWLGPGTLVAIFGFGLFAWAANPPPAKSAPPAWSLTIQSSAKP